MPRKLLRIKLSPKKQGPIKGDTPLPGLIDLDGPDELPEMERPRSTRCLQAAFSGVDPRPRELPQPSRGPVRQWFLIRGARGQIWVHGASAKDACGTYRISQYYKPWDDDPVWLGPAKIDLEARDAGLYRIGPRAVKEVTGPTWGEDFVQAA